MKLNVVDLDTFKVIRKDELQASSTLRDIKEKELREKYINSGAIVEIPFFLDETYSALINRNTIIHIATDSEDERRVLKALSLIEKGFTVEIYRDGKDGKLYRDMCNPL